MCLVCKKIKQLKVSKTKVLSDIWMHIKKIANAPQIVQYVYNEDQVEWLLF